MEKVTNPRGKKLSTAPSASRARGVCHTLESYGVINNPVFVIPRACAPARVRSEANLKAWREKHFGGDFDPVAAIVDEAEKRMVDAIDYKADKKARKNRIDTAIRRLSKNDRTFVRGILSGKDWRKMGIAKSTFSDRLKKVEKLLSCP